jgi:alpha-tubulin suppressor-like RCC1 family protein
VANRGLVLAVFVLGACHRSSATMTTGAMHAPAAFAASQVAVGSNHVCALEADGTVWCWGRDNGYGQLGDGTWETHGEPRAIPRLSGVEAIAAGFQHTCALARQGQVLCWGENQQGQLGDGTRRGRSSPTPVAGLPASRAIYAGPVTTCAEDTGGVTWCWGSLPATGSEPDAWGGSYPEPRPRRVAGLPVGLKTMSIGFSHLCAIPSDGMLRCWGNGFLGEMGDGTDRSRVVADLVPGLPAASAAGAGDNFSCALVGGELRCWGFGTTSSGAWSPAPSAGCDRSPCKIPSSTALASLAATRVLCALDSAGGVQCLGSGGIVPQGRPTTWLGAALTPIPLGVRAVALSLGPTFGCALADTGALACFDVVEPPHTGAPAPTHPFPVRH